MKGNIIMTDQEMLNKINKYAENVLSDIDPQKTKISFQLDKLKPVMQEIADEEGVAIEDIFIKYMDLATLQKIDMEKQFQQTMEEAGVTDLGKLEF
ncbi:MAG: hypothetical protein MJZ11_00310 [Lachnospiraceae bacterium]|nr:hypothetical protein [Lachnospiraceae bacterium]